MTKEEKLEFINKANKNTLMEVMGIEYTDVGENFVCGKMPVDNRTHQPLGLLHGGANAALVETLGSMGTYLLLDKDKEYATGIEMNANHIRGMRSGEVYGKATIIHKGRRTHIWHVDITNEEGKLVATGRLTMLIMKK